LRTLLAGTVSPYIFPRLRQGIICTPFTMDDKGMTSTLTRTLTLPCGIELPNRLAKAAMTEGLATPQGLPTPELERLYGLWSDGGAGMLLTGNIMIDADHLERPGNVVIDHEPNAQMQTALAAWAKAGTRNGNHLWAQISHGGRQTQKIVNPHPKAPSAVKVGLPGGHRLPSRSRKLKTSSVVLGSARLRLRRRDLPVCRFMGLTVTCCPSFSVQEVTSAAINTVVAWKTGRELYWMWCAACALRWARDFRSRLS